VGLALATSLAAFLNAGLLMQGLRADGVFRFQPGWLLLLPASSQRMGLWPTS